MNPTTIAAAKKAAVQYRVPLNNLLAVIEIESLGIITEPIVHKDGTTKDEPVIRWEGHYFHRRLKGYELNEAVKKGLASPSVGGISNPAKQQGRWDKLLVPAMELNSTAAIESVSWGIGQVMGAHWQKLDYPSAASFLAAVRRGIDGQIEVMLRYIEKFGLLDELRRGDFDGFARGYNGPLYKKYDYANKMRRAANKYASIKDDTLINPVSISLPRVPAPIVPTASDASSMVRLGVKGAKVREAQTLLTRAGFPVNVDGDFGQSTKRATESFQLAQRIKVDGMIGPNTWAKLEAFRASPDELPGVPTLAEAATQTTKGREGLVIAVAGPAILETVKAGLATATDQLQLIQGTVAIVDTIYSYLTIGSVVVGLVGVGFVIYGYYRSNTTRGLSPKVS